MIKIPTLYNCFIKQLHYIYLLYAIPMVCATVILSGPFQNPDEPNHFMRAEQVSRLELLPSFVHTTKVNNTVKSADSTVLTPPSGGFKVDKGITSTVACFGSVFCHNDRTFSTHRLNKEMFYKAEKYKWRSGIELQNFANTAIYVPIIYAMPAIGIAIGKAFDLSIIKTLYLSRLLNGALAILFFFLALKFAKRSNILMFIVSLLPMTVSLCASISQDAILISCAFLLVAIIDNIEFNSTAQYTGRQICAITLLMIVIGTAKPPYALFMFAFLSLNTKQKISIIAIPIFAILTWLAIDHNNLSITFAPAEYHFNAKLQILHILQHPFRFLGLYFKFDLLAIASKIMEAIGILGWLDVSFSHAYYVMAGAIILTGFILNFQFKRHDHNKVRAALLMSSLITTIGVIATQYITWTSLDSPTLCGMQGRYLLPIFPLLALAVSKSSRDENLSTPKALISLLPIFFPIVTAVCLIEVLLNRYIG